MFAHALLAAAAIVAAPSTAVATPESAAIVVIAAPDDPPPPTINEFLPEDRAISDCISALPKPGCGSEARGGWRQGLILVAILAGLAFIAWRVVRSARRARVDAEPTSTG